MANDYMYMDHAAATPLDASVYKVMQPFLTEQYYNPSATYLPAVQVRKALEQARRDVAGAIGARPSEIVFAAGGSESNNLAIQGVMGAYSGYTMVTTAIEHDSVLKTAQTHQATVVGVDASGIVSVEKLLAAITDSTVLVSVMYANNEIGTIQPIRKIAQALEPVRKARLQNGSDVPLLLHTDAAQAGNYLDLHVARLGVDLLSINGSKIYGPKQSGMLYVRASVRLLPLIYGGGQEHGLRSGTENVASAVGLAAALSLATQLRPAEVARLSELQRRFIKGVRGLPTEAMINGSTKLRLPNNVHASFPGADNERLLLELEQRHILAAAGSACSASNDEPSHVLSAIGLNEAEARSSLRFTLGRQTSEADIDAVLRALTQILA